MDYWVWGMQKNARYLSWEKVSCVLSPLVCNYLITAYKCYCIFIIQVLQTAQVLNSKCHAVSLFVCYFYKLLDCWEYLHSQGNDHKHTRLKNMLLIMDRELKISDLGVTEVRTFMLRIGIDLDWCWSLFLKWFAAYSFMVLCCSFMNWTVST